MELIKNSRPRAFKWNNENHFGAFARGGGGVQIGAHQHFGYAAVYNAICYILIYT